MTAGSADAGCAKPSSSNTLIHKCIDSQLVLSSYELSTENQGYVGLGRSMFFLMFHFSALLSLVSSSAVTLRPSQR